MNATKESMLEDLLDPFLIILDKDLHFNDEIGGDDIARLVDKSSIQLGFFQLLDKASHMYSIDFSTQTLMTPPQAKLLAVQSIHQLAVQSIHQLAKADGRITQA